VNTSCGQVGTDFYNVVLTLWKSHNISSFWDICFFIQANEEVGTLYLWQNGGTADGPCEVDNDDSGEENGRRLLQGSSGAIEAIVKLNWWV